MGFPNNTHVYQRSYFFIFYITRRRRIQGTNFNFPQGGSQFFVFFLFSFLKPLKDEFSFISLEFSLLKQTVEISREMWKILYL